MGEREKDRTERERERERYLTEEEEEEEGIRLMQVLGILLRSPLGWSYNTARGEETLAKKISGKVRFHLCGICRSMKPNEWKRADRQT